MRPFLGRVFKHALGLAFVLALAQPLAARAYPELAPPAAYVAFGQKGDLEYKAFLRLLKGHFFVLHESVFCAGKALDERSRTGSWRQLGQGGLLQLASRNGPTLRLSVGGSGNLYGDMKPVVFGGADVVFKKTEDKELPYTVYGVLSFDGGRASLNDSASGRVFFLEADETLSALAGLQEELFVEAELQEQGKAAHLFQLHGASTQMPHLVRPSAELFGRVTRRGVWRMQARNLPPLDCVFTMNAERKGQFEARGPGLRLRAACVAGAGSLSFALNAADKAEAEILRAIGPTGLTGPTAGPTGATGRRGGIQEGSRGGLPYLLESVNEWDVEGEVLVLSRNGEELCILEKIAELALDTVPETTRVQ